MPDHLTLRIIHLTCVALSLVGFMLRGGLMLAGSQLIWNRWVRSLPHVVDTLLLGSGIWMAINLHQYPGTTPWLSAKLIALVIYIGLGFVALRKGRSKTIRVLALVAALATFAYIVAVAITRTPLI